MAQKPIYLTPLALSEWIPQLAREKRMYKFYQTIEWKTLRGQILDAAHHECEDCKKKSPAVIEPATCVHHDREVEKYPELALSVYYIDEHGQKRQQLYALCDRCHNVRHGRFNGPAPDESKFTNVEKW